MQRLERIWLDEALRVVRATRKHGRSSGRRCSVHTTFSTLASMPFNGMGRSRSSRMAGSMILARAAGLATALLIILGGTQARAIEHFGLSKSDQFLLCARTLFGK